MISNDIVPIEQHHLKWLMSSFEIWYLGIYNYALNQINILSNLWYKSHQIPKLKCFLSRLIVVFAHSTEARCQVKNEDVVGAAPTGDAPTTSEWSTILLPAKVHLYQRFDSNLCWSSIHPYAQSTSYCAQRYTSNYICVCPNHIVFSDKRKKNSAAYWTVLG